VQAVTVRRIDETQDRDLVRRASEGDEGAFRRLFQRYGPVAKALAVRIVRQPFLAEEVVQEAFLVLWRRPQSYREDRGTFRAWLLAAVHHRAVDLVRREEAHRRRAERSEREAELSLAEADIAGDVVDDTELARSRERIRRALQEIPAEQREVLELMYYEAKTQSIIAQELEIPLGTVKSRTLLGMRRMRSLLMEGAP
jgi:RNA polymerase sigma-70 factor (ECF subfamily)